MSLQSNEFRLAGWDIPAVHRCRNTGRPMRECNTCGGLIPAHWHDCTPEQLAAKLAVKAAREGRDG